MKTEALKSFKRCCKDILDSKLSELPLCVLPQALTEHVTADKSTLTYNNPLTLIYLFKFTFHIKAWGNVLMSN